MKKLITLAAIAAMAYAKKMPVELGGVSCQTPPPLHCPDKDCPGSLVIQETSAWAEKLGCGARVQKADVVDEKAGYVYDSTRQDPGSDGWGRLPRPGTAEVFEYPHCKGGSLRMW